MKKLLTIPIILMTLHGCSGSPDIIDPNGGNDNNGTENTNKPNENGNNNGDNNNNNPDDGGNNDTPDKPQPPKDNEVNNGINIGINDWNKDGTDNGGTAE